jgi:hypothetical protein
VKRLLQRIIYAHPNSLETALDFVAVRQAGIGHNLSFATA